MNEDLLGIYMLVVYIYLVGMPIIEYIYTRTQCRGVKGKMYAIILCQGACAPLVWGLYRVDAQSIALGLLLLSLLCGMQWFKWYEASDKGKSGKSGGN